MSSDVGNQSRKRQGEREEVSVLFEVVSTVACVIWSSD